MQNPKETVTISFKNIPTSKVAIIKELVYTIKYKADERDAIVYDMILKNPTTPLKELQRRLRNEYKLQKTINKIRQIALDCCLVYAE
jgi:hypothetical protein